VGPVFEDTPTLRNSQLISLDEILEQEMMKFSATSDEPISQLNTQQRQSSKRRIIDNLHSAVPFEQLEVIFKKITFGF
jgi:hypothetical protein